MLRDPEKLVKLGENNGAIKLHGMLCLPPTELRATLMQMCDGLMVVAGLLLAVSAMMLFASPTKNHDENSTLFFRWWLVLAARDRGFFISCIFVCNGFSLAPSGWYTLVGSTRRLRRSAFPTPPRSSNRCKAASSRSLWPWRSGSEGTIPAITAWRWASRLASARGCCSSISCTTFASDSHRSLESGGDIDKGFLFMALMWSGLRDNRAKLLARANAEARMVADEIEESAGLMRRDDRVPVDTTVVGE